MFRFFNALKRLSELEDEMAKLARIVGDRELDWLDMRARCKRLLDRTEKAAARAESKLEEPGDATNAANVFDHLTPSQRRLQEQVERRRQLMGLKREAS